MQPLTVDNERAPSLASRHVLAYGRYMQTTSRRRVFDLNWNLPDAQGGF